MSIFQVVKNAITSKERKERIAVIKKRKNIIIFVVILIFMYVVLSNTIFSEKRIGTKQHRKEAPYCQSDDECLLYNCTNCGNKFWVNKNDDTVCDKELSIIIGCECIGGKCKRVIRK